MWRGIWRGRWIGLMKDLRWAGIEWDEGPDIGVSFCPLRSKSA